VPFGSVQVPQYVRSVDSAGPQRTLLSRFLDTNGDGSGTKNANGNYSAAEEIFYIQPGAAQVFRIARMLVTIEDTNGMSATDYGNITSGLSTGVEIRVQDDSGTLVDLTDGLPVTNNAGWGSFCYDVDLKTWSTGNELLLVRWTFTKSGQYIRLRGANNERLEVVLNDQLTGLVGHYFLVQGYIE
jgi:hypothetical protein